MFPTGMSQDLRGAIPEYITVFISFKIQVQNLSLLTFIVTNSHNCVVPSSFDINNRNFFVWHPIKKTIR